MTDQPYLTAEGAFQLKKELSRLKGPDREAIAKRLREAVQQGDLSENADYHKAKEDQGFLEGRIQELEYLLANAIIVENQVERHEEAAVGARVTIQEPGEPPETFYLVGAKETDPRNGRISYESPIGQALMGKRVGEEVFVDTPDGSINFKIINIE